jgi:voltage-gated potassium channel Kch
VIIAGFGTFGNTIGRFLKAHGIEATYLDHDSDQVSFLRKKGFKVYYGDASEMEILKLAGANEARLLVIAIDNPEKSMEMVKKVKKYFPQLKVLVRVRNRHYAYEMINEGVNEIYRENFDTSLRMSKDILKILGYNDQEANKAADIFFKADESNLRELALLYKDKKQYINLTVEKLKELEDMLRKENQGAELAKKGVIQSSI